MIKKVIILTAYPFNQRDFSRYGVQLMRTRGLDVEIWDITTCIHKKISNKLASDNSARFDNLRTFTDTQDLIRAISLLDTRCIVNCFIEYSIRTFFVFKAISKYHIHYCVLAMATHPNPKPVRSGFFQRTTEILKKIYSLKFVEIVAHFLNRGLLKYYFLFGISPASIIIIGGEKSIGMNPYPVNKATRRLWAHTFDYDIFLRERDSTGTPSKKYNVFLDEYLPFHPDFLTMGIGYPLPPEDYYPALGNFLKVLEEKTGAETLIAAHPRSSYESMPDFFSGRPLFKGKTSLLVKNANLVIAHMSTSVNFAVLYRKPIVFITSDKLKKMNSGKNITGLYIQTMAGLFGKEPVNVDHLEEFSMADLMNIDDEVYTKYILDYIKKPGTPEKPIWDIFSSYLQQHYSS